MRSSSYILAAVALLAPAIAAHVSGVVSRPESPRAKAPARFTLSRQPDHTNKSTAKCQPQQPRQASFGLDAEDAYIRLPSDLLPSTCPVTKNAYRKTRPSRFGQSSKRGIDACPSPSSREHPSQDTPQRLFLGYRGTTHRVAHSYRTQGLAGGLANGNLPALGEGIYVTDDVHVALGYAQLAVDTHNDKLRDADPDTQSTPDRELAHPSVCTIFANDAAHFTAHTPKVFLPPSTWADILTAHWAVRPAILARQARWIKDHVPSQALGFAFDSAVETPDVSAVVKFTNLNVRRPVCRTSANQMFVPTAQLPRFSIGTCVDYRADDAAAVLELGLPTLWDPRNRLDYRLKLEEWNIYGMVADKNA